MTTAAAVGVRKRDLSENLLALNFSRLMVLLAAGLFLEAGIRNKLLDPLFFSSPSLVFNSLVSQLSSGVLVRNIAVTLVETVLGFIVGSAFGILAGLALSRARFMARVLDPYLMMIYATPTIVLAPLFVLILGIGLMSKIAIIFLHTSLIAFIAVYYAAIHCDEDLINAVKVMGGNKRQIFWKVIFPATGPAIYAGLKLAIGVSLIGAIVGEFIAARAGLGYMIIFASGILDTPSVYLGIFFIALMAAGLNEGINQLGKVLVRWKFYDEK